MNAIGQQGFQLFVDIGQPVDPDLIQALVREVLEEKISSMSLNKEILPEDRSQLAPASTGQFIERRRSFSFGRNSAG